MKSIQFIWTVAAAMVVTACTSEQTLEEVFSNGEINEVKITATNFDYSDAATRTSFAITSSGAEFTWAANDTVGIFPNTGNQVEFPMTAGAGTQSAAFNGGGWGLKSGSTYYAYYPFSKYNYLLNDAKSKIPVSYTGQKQTGSDNTAHLGTFDFMAAAGSSPANGALSFQFAHLNALVQIKIPAPAAATYKSLKLSASSPIFVESATVDLTASTPVVTATKLSNSLTLDLDVTATNAGDYLFFYMMLAPMDDFSGVKAHLTDADNNKTIFKLSPKDKLEAGFAYAVSGSIPEYVEFEDAKFEAYMLLTTNNFDKNGDGKISLAEAAAVTTIKYNNSPNLTSLAGIEYCYNLTSLECTVTGLTSLDVSGLTALQYLNCGSNSISSLDVSGCTALQELSCGTNRLTSLDVSTCTSLQRLDCGSNRLTSLDVSNNKELTYLSCTQCWYLTYLNAKNCRKLTTIECCNCYGYSLEGSFVIDVSGCTSLTQLECYKSRVVSLNASGCIVLDKLDCSDNPNLSTLNLDGCVALTNLNCSNGYFQRGSLSDLDVSGLRALKYLRITYSKMASLDLSNNENLDFLDCSYTGIESLNVSNCTALTRLVCFANNLTTLDVSNNKSLVEFYCLGNPLETLYLPAGVSMTTCQYPSNVTPQYK